ncbi:hypothetical protein N8537_00055 [Synechococcus sp. AH-601-J22]|nr:hypothetical protein [Synechococcus sp. AH-601-J22]
MKSFIKIFINRKALSDHFSWVSRIIFVSFHLKPNRFLTRSKAIIKNKIIPGRVCEEQSQALNIESSLFFERQGFLLLENFINKESVDRFITQRREYLPEGYFDTTPLQSYQRGKPIPPDILEEIFNISLLQIFSKSEFRNMQPYFLTQPYTALTRIISGSSGLPEGFHVDQPYQARITILLNDIDSSCPHMQVIPGSQRIINCLIANLRIKKLTGLRGSVIAHNGNVFHRLKLGNQEMERLTLNLSFGFRTSTDLEIKYKKRKRAEPSNACTNKGNNMSRLYKNIP